MFTTLLQLDWPGESDHSMSWEEENRMAMEESAKHLFNFEDNHIEGKGLEFLQNYFQGKLLQNC
jgi:hypothetical protein